MWPNDETLFETVVFVMPKVGLDLDVSRVSNKHSSKSVLSNGTFMMKLYGLEDVSLAL